NFLRNKRDDVKFPKANKFVFTVGGSATRSRKMVAPRGLSAVTNSIPLSKRARGRARGARICQFADQNRHADAQRNDDGLHYRSSRAGASDRRPELRTREMQA